MDEKCTVYQYTAHFVRTEKSGVPKWFRGLGTAARGLRASVFVLERTYLLDFFLEVFARPDGVVLHFRPVVVDGVDRVAQQSGYFRRVADAQPDKCEDAEFGVEQFSLLGLDMGIGPQQGVELVHEVGVEVQEGVVGGVVEFLHIAVHHLR